MQPAQKRREPLDRGYLGGPVYEELWWVAAAEGAAAEGVRCGCMPAPYHQHVSIAEKICI